MILVKEHIDKIKQWKKQGVSLSGITSLLYINGITGIKYRELFKYVKKECQRIK